MFTKYDLFFKYAKQKNSILTTNKLFTKCPKPLFQSEGNCEAIDANENDFHTKNIFTRKLLHLVSFWKWEFLELENGKSANLPSWDAPGASSRVSSSRESNAWQHSEIFRESYVYRSFFGDLVVNGVLKKKKERKFMYPSKQNYDDSRSFFKVSTFLESII